MASFHKIVVLVGFISLFHSAFSAAQHRSYLRITSQEFTSLPLDLARYHHAEIRFSLSITALITEFITSTYKIVVQAVGSLFAVMWGVLHLAGGLKEIHAAAELNNLRWENQRNIPSFYMFNHRGKCFSQNYYPISDKREEDPLLT